MVEATGAVASTEKRKRAKNWDTHEILLLVQARKEEWERHEVSSQLETAGEKWSKVVEFLHTKGIVDRDTDQCRGKWDNLLSDYKTIRDWRQQAGSRAYTTLTRDEKRLSKLPACFDSQVMELLESFQGKKPSPTAVPCSSVLPMDSSSDALLPASFEPEANEDELTDEAQQKKEDRRAEALARGEEGREGGRKRKKRNKDMVSVLRDLTDFYISSVVGLEKRRDKRHAKLLEFEKEKLVMERQDRRDLIGVLGELAKAFEKIADKV